MSSTLSRSTIAKNKILGFAKKEHIKEFQNESVRIFNVGEKLPQYYNWKRMLLGLFAAELEARGVDIKTVDTSNINYIVGRAK